VGLRDIKEEKIELTEKSFSLSMKSDGKAYADSLNLFGEIVKDVLTFFFLLIKKFLILSKIF